MTFVDDVVEANIRLIDPDVKLAGQSINIGSGRRLSVNQLLDVLRDLTESDIAARYQERAVGDARDTWASIDAAQELIGYSPSTRLEKGIERFLEWFRGDEEAREMTL
jgi:UDP-glucose 4-epimerase